MQDELLSVHHELILVEWLDTITYGCGKFLVGGHDHNLNNQSKEDDFRPQLCMAGAAESFFGPNVDLG